MIRMLAPPELSAFVTDPEVEAYAKRFRAAWRSSVESIIESGQVLVEAKQALGYGRYGALVDTLGLGRTPETAMRTAHRLGEIFRDVQISTLASVLSPHCSTPSDRSPRPD